MKIYTAYSDSHKGMFEQFFLPTVPKEFDLKIEVFPQECPSGTFYEKGWGTTCRRKIDLFVRACEENMGTHFVFADADLQFFGNCKDVLLEELGEKDFACQNDVICACSGFFIAKGNQKVLDMFHRMGTHYEAEDQTSLNRNLHMVDWKMLSHRFFTIAMVTGNRWYGQDVEIPKDILVHHANWTTGVDNKIKLLEFVKAKMAQ